MTTKHLAPRLLVVTTFVWLVMALYTPFVGSYYTEQGLKNSQIGILTSIGPVVAFFLQPLWGIISDRIGRRRMVLMIISLGSSMAVLTYLLNSGFWTFFLATVLLTCFSSSIIPLSDALIVHHSRKNNINFAHLRIGGTLSFAITVIIIGNIVKDQSHMIFIFGSVGYLIYAALLLFMPKDQVQLNASKRFGRISNVFKNNQIYYVLFFALMYQLGISFYGSFYGVYVVKLGYGTNIVGISSCISALSEVPILLFVNRIIKKFGALKLLAFSVAMMSLRLTLAASGVLPLMLMSQLLQSVTYMTCYYSCVMFVSENTEEGKFSQGQSILAMVQGGIGSILGNLLGGFTTERFGIKNSFLGMAAFLVIISVFNFYIINKNNKRLRQATDVA